MLFCENRLGVTEKDFGAPSQKNQRIESPSVLAAPSARNSGGLFIERVQSGVPAILGPGSALGASAAPNTFAVNCSSSLAHSRRERGNIYPQTPPTGLPRSFLTVRGQPSRTLRGQLAPALPGSSRDGILVKHPQFRSLTVPCPVRHGRNPPRVDWTCIEPNMFRHAATIRPSIRIRTKKGASSKSPIGSAEKDCSGKYPSTGSPLNLPAPHDKARKVWLPSSKNGLFPARVALPPVPYMDGTFYRPGYGTSSNGPLPVKAANPPPRRYHAIPFLLKP